MRPQLCIAAAFGLMVTASALQGAITATASSTDGKSVQATFDSVDGQLVIRITNLSSSDTLSARDVLTGVYFNSSQSLSLDYVGAATGQSSQVVNGADTDNLNRQWTLGEGSSFQSRTGARYGVGSASLGGLFSGTGGVNFGLTGLGDDTDTGGSGVTNKALVQNEVIIVLDGLPAGFTEMDITSVIFQFGTRRRDQRLIGELALSAEDLEQEADRVDSPGDPAATPAPTALLGGLALMGYMAAKRRKRSDSMM